MLNSNFGRKKLFFGLILVLVLIFIYLAFLVYNSQKSETQKKTALETQQQPQARTAPTVDFKSWVFKDTKAQTKAQATLYPFKTSFSSADVLLLARRLSVLGAIKKEGDFALVSSKDSLLLVNTKEGGYTFASGKGVSLSSDLQSFVSSLTSDQTLSVFASYKKRSVGDAVTFYEVHRDWSKVGLPILNTFGLLNLPEGKTLASLSFATKEGLLTDSDIYETSDNGDGLARANDFNTMTIGVLKDSEGKQHVISIRSSIRPLKKETPQNSSLISFDEAVQNIMDRKYDYVLTAPAGQGEVDFDKVYPQNKAVADIAQVNDCILAYVENPPTVTQDRLTPSYICRGEAQLVSGYRVMVVAVTSAVKTNTLGLHEVFAQEDQEGLPPSQQQGTFESPPTPTPTEEPVQDSSQKQGTLPTQPPVHEPPPQAVPQTFNCWDFLFFTERITINGVEYGFAHGNWYILPTSQVPQNLQAEVDSVLNQLEANIPSNYGLENFRVQIGPSSGADCPIQVATIQVATINSPTLFVYGLSTRDVSLKPEFELTYFDKNQDYIYYEYAKKSFNKPSDGWVIEKKNLAKLAANISEKLKLTTKEKERLLFELNHAAYDVEENTLFVGLISEDEVNKKLPLSVSPKPEKIVRYHFYVSKASTNEVKPPTLSPLKRSSYMILELGAASQ